MSEDLEPFDPATAKEMYLEARIHDLAQSTLQSHDYRLKQFVQWCDSIGLENLNDITRRHIHQFRVKRRTEDDPSITAIKGQLATLRVSLRFCVSIDAVESGLDGEITTDIGVVGQWYS
ncbi:site-specific integrase [Halobium palmae]|uniref:Site-specific integrase n=1 Tax=Halobium palmae TaxID=1776492 RepID=A0ABD5RX78_9EURY